MNFLIFLFLGEALVVLGGFFAYRDKFFTVSQMQNRGIVQGLPFAMHAGMWGDFLIVSPIIAVIISVYANSWSPNQVLAAVFGGLFFSLIMHFLYTKIEIPESHVVGGHLTKAGIVHVFYMALAFTVLFLLYFFTPKLSYISFAIFSTLFAIHVLFSNHVILEITKPSWYGKHHFKDSLFILSVVTMIVLLAWRCYALYA